MNELFELASAMVEWLDRLLGIKIMIHFGPINIPNRELPELLTKFTKIAEHILVPTIDPCPVDAGDVDTRLLEIWIQSLGTCLSTLAGPVKTG